MKKSIWVLVFLRFLFSGLPVYKYHNMAHGSTQGNEIPSEKMKSNRNGVEVRKSS